MSDARTFPLWLTLISGLVTLFLWTTDADASERLRLECVGEAGFAATGTLQWLDDDGGPLGTAVTLSCTANRRSPEVKVVVPENADEFEITVTVTQGSQSNTCVESDDLDEPEDFRQRVECRLDPDLKKPRATFKMNR